MNREIKILRDIGICLVIIVALESIYDRKFYVWPINAESAAIWAALGTFIQAFIAYLLYKITLKQAFISEQTLEQAIQANKAAAESIRIDRNAMTLSERPWLKFSIDQTKKGNSIRWNGNTMLANMWFSVTNVGKSPALNVTLRYTLEVRHFGGAQSASPYIWHHERLKKFADGIAAQYDPTYPSYTIFPGDTETVYQMGGVSDLNGERINDIFDYLKSINANPTNKFLGFTFLGVVYYQFEVNGERYQTGKILEISSNSAILFGSNIENQNLVVNEFLLGRAHAT